MTVRAAAIHPGMGPPVTAVASKTAPGASLAGSPDRGAAVPGHVPAGQAAGQARPLPTAQAPRGPCRSGRLTGPSRQRPCPASLTARAARIRPRYGPARPLPQTRLGRRMAARGHWQAPRDRGPAEGGRPGRRTAANPATVAATSRPAMPKPTQARAPRPWQERPRPAVRKSGPAPAEDPRVLIGFIIGACDKIRLFVARRIMRNARQARLQ